MNGIHDLGGMHGFGDVDRSPEPPLERWEAAMIAIQSAVDGPLINIDTFRHAIERMDAGHYLQSTYFEHWLDGIVRALDEAGVVSLDEYTARFDRYRENPEESLPPRGQPAPRRRKDEGHPFRRPAVSAPRFAVGDEVLTRNFQPAGHTRLARYARGRRGVIAGYHDVMVFPDTNAAEAGEHPQPLYSVRFEAAELWGEDAGNGEAVYIDLWESYLRPLEAS